MALFNVQDLKALVLIEDKKNNKFSPIASGSLIGFLVKKVKDPTRRRYRIFLLTNRHVFDDREKIWLRFNKKGGGIARFPVRLLSDSQLLWLTHKNKKVDIAMLTISASFLKEKQVDWLFFNEEMFAYIKNFTNIGIAIGDPLYVLGFPLGLSGVSKNYPLVRSGIISRVDKEIIREEKAFFIDAFVFPGNSGGPVLLKPTVASLKGTPAVKSVYLLGTVSSYIPYKEILYSHQTKPPSYAGISMENSGLSLVVPMDFTRQIYRDWIKSKKKMEKAQKGIEKTIQEKIKPLEKT